jgi:hypothetical protein
MELTVAITGASGAIYAQKTLTHLASSGVVERINLIFSESARTVAMVELGFDLRSADEKKLNDWIGLPPDAKTLRLHRLDNMAGYAVFRFAPAGRHDHCSVFDGNPGRDCFGRRHEFDSPGRGCDFEGGPKVGSGPARNALQCDPS